MLGSRLLSRDKFIKLLIKLRLLAVIVGIFVLYSLTAAQAGTPNLSNAFGQGSQLDIAAGKAGYDPALVTPDSFFVIVIETALSFIGVLFLVLMIYGGYLWMTARGNEPQVEKSKNLIIAAIIGLLIVLSAYAISNYIVGKLAKQTLQQSSAQ